MQSVELVVQSELRLEHAAQTPNVKLICVIFSRGRITK